MKFNEKLIELRKQHGLSQEELGNKINVSRQSISKWESRQANPEIEKVKEISKVFNVSIEYLLNDECEKRDETKDAKTKINFWQITKIVLIIILVIYILIVIYKFAILLTYSIKANNICDYDNYGIIMSYTGNDKLQNKSFNYSQEINFANNIEICEEYDYILEKTTSITYKNLKERKAYSLQYDSEIEKYVYTNLTDCTDIDEDYFKELFKYTTIREITQESIPNDIGAIILNATHPKVKVSIDRDYVYIKSQNPNSIGGYIQVQIDKNTGIVNEIMGNTDRESYVIHYNYFFDDTFIDEGLIEETYLDDIEYVMEDEVYE